MNIIEGTWTGSSGTEITFYDDLTCLYKEPDSSNSSLRSGCTGSWLISNNKLEIRLSVNSYYDLYASVSKTMTSFVLKNKSNATWYDETFTTSKTLPKKETKTSEKKIAGEWIGDDGTELYFNSDYTMTYREPKSSKAQMRIGYTGTWKISNSNELVIDVTTTTHYVLYAQLNSYGKFTLKKRSGGTWYNETFSKGTSGSLSLMQTVGSKGRTLKGDKGTVIVLNSDHTLTYSQPDSKDAKMQQGYEGTWVTSNNELIIYITTTEAYELYAYIPYGAKSFTLEKRIGGSWTDETFQ